MTPLSVPQVNLNGTSRESLVKQQVEIVERINSLLTAMSNAMPHGRDYQLRPEEYTAARIAWSERVRMVLELHHEIQQHAIAIASGGDA